jgi:hypothetical protein
MALPRGRHRFLPFRFRLNSDPLLSGTVILKCSFQRSFKKPQGASQQYRQNLSRRKRKLRLRLIRAPANLIGAVAPASTVQPLPKRHDP